MGVAKLTAMAFIEDEHHAFVLQPGHAGKILIYANRGIELLQGSHNQRRIIAKLLHQLFGVVSRVHTTRRETVELLDGLKIEVFPITYKYYLMHMGRLRQILRGLERGECFTGTRCMPDIAKLLGILYLLDNGLHP